MLKKELKGRKKFVIVVAIVLVAFALMTVNIKRSAQPTFIEIAVLWVVSPIQNLFASMVGGVSDTVNHYLLLVNTSKDNEKLRHRINALIKEKHALQEEVRRLNRISELKDYQETRPLKSTVATVIGRDATQWSKTVFINKGTRDGIREDQPVMTTQGLVGHIVQAGHNTSKVLLIVDSRSAVDALFESDRVSGVVVGTGKDICEMKYVPINVNVHIGDRVLSSGLGGIFPKGLRLGTVTEVQKATQGLFQVVRIVPSADLTRLEEVLVLLS